MRPENPPISDGVPEHVGPLPPDEDRETSDGVPEHIPTPNDRDEPSDGVPQYIPPNKRTPNP